MPIASAMLSAAIKGSTYSSLLPLSCHCLPVFDEICGTAMDFLFRCIYTTLQVSCISFIRNRLNVLQLHWHLPSLARNMASTGFPKNGQIPDLPEPKSSTTLLVGEISNSLLGIC